MRSEDHIRSDPDDNFDSTGKKVDTPMNDPRPGDESGFGKKNNGKRNENNPFSVSCTWLISAAKADGLRPVELNGKCRCFYHKVLLVIDPGKDYH